MTSRVSDIDSNSLGSSRCRTRQHADIVLKEAMSAIGDLPIQWLNSMRSLFLLEVETEQGRRGLCCSEHQARSRFGNRWLWGQTRTARPNRLVFKLESLCKAFNANARPGMKILEKIGTDCSLHSGPSGCFIENIS